MLAAGPVRADAPAPRLERAEPEKCAQWSLTHPPPDAPREARPCYALRWFPVAVSVVPGLLLHGLGPLAAGDEALSGRLFALEGVGLGLTFAGGASLALTGASRYVVGPLYAVTLTGVGLFSVSALANLYSVLSPALTPTEAPRGLPPLQVELGYQHVVDTAFSYRHFTTAGAQVGWGGGWAAARLSVSPDDGNLRARVGVAAWLLREALPGIPLSLEAAALVHRYPTEDFTLRGGELFLRGRYPLERLSARLTDSFAEMGAGLALQRYSYAGRVDDALYQELLFTFGYGVLLGRGGPFRGEALLYYDHRKDDFPGGLRVFGGGPAYFGLRGRVFLTERWGLSAETQVGSAWVSRVALVYGWGAGR